MNVARASRASSDVALISTPERPRWDATLHTPAAMQRRASFDELHELGAYPAA